VLHLVEEVVFGGPLALHEPLELDEAPGPVEDRRVQEVEVTHVGAVLGYFLAVTVDVVDALAARAHRVQLGDVEWFVGDFVLELGSGVEPDEDAVVELANVVLL